MKMNLNDNWKMLRQGREYPCAVPCSMYETLIRSGEIPDPYVGENEWEATRLSDEDTVFERAVSLAEPPREGEKTLLRFAGLDTLAEVYWDGELLGKADNMHRTWEFSLDGRDGAGEHRLRILFRSPSVYVTEAQKKRPLWCVGQAMPGYPHLRKAHSSFGWDWGPVLPDMGIWRDVTLERFAGGRILDVYYEQEHGDGRVTLTARIHTEEWKEGLEARLEITGPEGKTLSVPAEKGRAEAVIENPKLWWVRGLGDQPLYSCRVVLEDRGAAVDERTERIGLRTLTVSREKDAWGEEFTLVNNGVRFFAMGADYIPEDQLMPRCTPERTVRLLEDCAAANYNFIRVWGGGVYPGDAFYDFCDEHGLAVWQDFMFACASYVLTPDFEKTVRAEIRDNVVRLRNHASLGLWCGNNEIESAWTDWGLPEDPEARGDYLKLFEKIIPEILAETDPRTFYWPSSPSSGGGFREPSSDKAGDMHYWAVWHNFKPIEAFREHYYRFCSEYGFESLPDIKTVRFFAEEKDWDLCGTVMEAHQKCDQGTEKMLYYLGQMTNYAYDFPRLVYCSQLVQADCIRSNVEHMRRARGRCMGSAYWQVNDSNPVISWSSIDYFGRWKALHYAARRFYAPILLSCEDADPLHPVLHVTNDTREAQTLRISCRLRDASARVLREYETEAEVPALTAAACLPLDLEKELASREDKRSRYLEYTLEKDGRVIGAGTTLFVRPKAFAFRKAEIGVRIEETEDAYRLTLAASCFAKSVCLSLREGDCVFSDNWFDIHGGEPVTVTVDKARCGLGPEEFRDQLEIASY